MDTESTVIMPARRAQALLMVEQLRANVEALAEEVKAADAAARDDDQELMEALDAARDRLAEWVGIEEQPAAPPPFPPPAPPAPFGLALLVFVVVVVGLAALLTTGAP